MSKRIGVFTSGGDCAGLNAAIRSVTLSATKKGWEVFGILRGTSGLMARPLEYIVLNANNCDHNMLRSGGTMLGSINKENPFFIPAGGGSKIDRSDYVIQGYHDLKLDALIAIGGDGSMRINYKLAKKGSINLIGIPKTIDNDLAHTDYSIGYSTAVSVATEAIDRLYPTAASHQRIIILEVMGRDAGHIALASGIAGGADAILIPEIPYNIDALCNHLKNIHNYGRKFSVIVVSEAVKNSSGKNITNGVSHNDMPRYGGIAQHLCSELEFKLNADVRYNVLGHMQRGSQPNAYDRMLGTLFGAKAIDMVNEQKFNQMVIWRNNRIETIPIEQSIEIYNKINPNDFSISAAKSIGIYVGEI